MSISAFNGRVPSFGPGAFVTPMPPSSATSCCEEGANVWPGAVLRGDVERIHLGRQSSFQDNSVAHADPGFPWSSAPTAWSATASSCTAAPWARAPHRHGRHLLNGCEIGEDCIVGAGSLVTQGKMFPPRSLIMGSPAKLVREVTDDDLAPRSELRDRYVRRSAAYAELGLGADLAAFRR